MIVVRKVWWDGDQIHTQEVPLGWNGKGMWLHLVTPDNSIPLGYPIQPYIAMKTADDKMQPGRLASWL